MQPLPIDPLLPGLVETLTRSRALVLEAPPGAGKTTRVPRALLDANVPASGQILVLEPRRLAARMAARRVAEELGEPLGERVGYTVRFEDVSSARTRIRFLTEGTLARWLERSPELAGVGAVLLDEFHERHLETDLCLALLARLQATRRPDLLLVVMSATLDGARVAAYLGCPSLRAEGRRFDVAIEYAPKPDDRPLALQVTSALRELSRRASPGHALVFLPGAREIQRALAAAAALCREQDMDLLPLHGDLSPDEQDRVLRPGPRRKVILSTNVAESSVTIDGVGAVIDGGLARTVVHSPWTGFSALRTGRVSRASATQRAGRAGRTQSGVCLRLYTRHDHDTRPEHDLAEVLRADLCEPLLALAAQGISPEHFRWFEAPPEAAIAAARALLRRLGALDEGAAITEMGRQMRRFPLHPRQARLLLEADRAHAADEGAALAALLGERDIRREDRAARGAPGSLRSASAEATGSDLLARLDDLGRAARERLSAAEMRAIDLDPAAVFAVERARKQLGRLVSARRSDSAADEESLRRAILVSFPDRVARRRRPGGRDLVLSGGGTAQQGSESQVHDAPFVVVTAASEGERGPLVATSVSAIEPEWLLELFPAEIHEARERSWNAEAERVDVVERLMYGELSLDETRGGGAPDDETGRILAEAALKRGLAAFVSPPEAAERWLGRARFLGEQLPDMPRFDEAGLEERMRSLCSGKRSFAELRGSDLLGELSSLLRPDQAQKLASWAPERIELLGGRKAEVHYEPGKPPYVKSRLQDFFGMQKTPAIAGGRVPLTLHLLAPNQRPVQITSDLAGFWQNHYPQIRRELGRKYPRHPWPDDPTRALPPEAPRRR